MTKPLGDIEPIYQEIGRRIARYRQEAGLNPEELARRAGTFGNSIIKWERAENRILTHRVAEVAYALGVAPSSLLPGGRRAVPNPPPSPPAPPPPAEAAVLLKRLRHDYGTLALRERDIRDVAILQKMGEVIDRLEQDLKDGSL